MRSDFKTGAGALAAPVSFKKAFTLVEILIALVVMAVLAGGFAVVRGPEPTPEREAAELARWLTRLTVISNRSGRPFDLVCPWTRRGYVEALWHHSSDKNVYTARYGCTFGNNGSSGLSHYSPQWGTLTPTVTIVVSRGSARHYVVVSQHGRVRTAPSI